MLRMVGDVNDRFKKERVKDIALGLMDVVALYPSLDQEGATK